MGRNNPTLKFFFLRTYLEDELEADEEAEDCRSSAEADNPNRRGALADVPLSFVSACL
jgi:hypothetical protein